VGLGTITGALSPWLLALADFELISGYFQPKANGLASILAAVFFLVGFGVLRTATDKRIKELLLKSFIPLLGLCLLLCLAFKFAPLLFPTLSPVTSVLFWIAWIIAYVGLFVFFALVLCLAALLAT
jgi:hypothetical protein